MHLSLFTGALLVWAVVLDRSARGVIPSLAVSAFTTVQMTFLGALITIAHQTLYLPHALTTAAWGLTPLADQQLGGLIMCVPSARSSSACRCSPWPGCSATPAIRI